MTDHLGGGPADGRTPFDVDGIAEQFELHEMTRRGMLKKGLGGLVAAGAAGSLLGATPAFARSTARARRSATTVTMWGNHPEWKPVLD